MGVNRFVDLKYK